MSFDREILFAHESSEWRTPTKLFDNLDLEFSFELDAAASEANHLCFAWFDKEQDGLNQVWYTHGNTFVNPPYGKEIKFWVEKAWKESQKGINVVMVLPARTDTIWFHEFVYGRAEIRFLRGRLKFLDINGHELSSAPFPSMIVVFRPPHQRKM